MVTLLVDIHDPEGTDLDTWSSVIVILLQATSLTNLRMYGWPMKVGYLSTIVQVASGGLTNLHMRISPTEIDTLVFLRHFTQLRDLGIQLDDGEVVDTSHTPSLQLPFVKCLEVSASESFFEENSGADDILSYIATARFHNDCRGHFSLPLWSYIRLDPFFRTHSSSYLFIGVPDDPDGAELPAMSAVFERSQSVEFDGFIPSPTIFDRDRLPHDISIIADIDNGDPINFWAVLDMLAQSTKQHDLRLHVKIMGYAAGAGFYWSAQIPAEEMCQEECAWFTIKIMRRLQSLHERGITILDQRGRTFSEEFSAILDKPTRDRSASLL
jgi:hypothetical protein